MPEGRRRTTAPPRTHYELTAEGVEALREGLAEPSSLPRVQHEALLRVLAADLGRDEDVLASPAALREDVEAKRSLLVETKERPQRCRTGSGSCASCIAWETSCSTRTSSGSTR